MIDIMKLPTNKGNESGMNEISTKKPLLDKLPKRVQEILKNGASLLLC